MSGRLTYRPFEERDLPGLLRLWEGAGWGTLTAEQWREWFVETPNGPCLIVVAEDSAGEIAAQEIFTPARLAVGGREVMGLRFSAPILRADLRGESLRRGEHPIIGLYKAAACEAARRGFAVVYSLPEHGWLPIFRLVPKFGIPPFAEATYPCAALSLEGSAVETAVATSEGLEAGPVAEFGAEYVELWEGARSSVPVECGVVRDPHWLRFRNGGRLALEVRDSRDGSLVGYTATKRQTGLLADALARTPEELAGVIGETARWLARERGRLAPGGLTHLKAMRTPALAPALDALGFEPTDFKFAFTCNTFGPALATADVAPERWYVMPGD
jgi:hypothetical protein